MNLRNTVYNMLVNAFILFILLVVPNDVFCSNLIYRENFDDQTVSSPPFGHIDIKKGSGLFATYSNDYFWAIGRGGTGYSFSGQQNKAAHLLWWMNKNWSTDEVFVSFWMRYANYTQGKDATSGNPETNENFKEFRPIFGSGASGDGHLSLVTTVNGQMNSPVAADTGKYLTISNYISTPNHMSGGWHLYEFWVKFSTAQFRFWYDSVLKINKDYPDQTDGQATWSGYITYLTLGSVDAEEAGTFMRQYDDWEVWDGMPSSRSGNSSSPSPPSALIIK